MKAAVAVLALSLCACQMDNRDVAKACGVAQAELDAGFASVDKLAVGQTQTVGNCTLKKVAGSKRVVVLISKDGSFIG